VNISTHSQDATAHGASSDSTHWPIAVATESPLQRWSRDQARQWTSDIPPTPRNCTDVFVKQSGHCN